MYKKRYLIIAGSLNFFIAIMHIIAIFVGSQAYYFMDAPQLAVYSELGYSFPAWITFFVSCLFFAFGLYAFCEAGSKIKLPFQRSMIRIIGTLFILRGTWMFWFIYKQIAFPTDRSLKEIVFSLFALVVGILYFLGIQKKDSTKEVLR